MLDFFGYEKWGAAIIKIIEELMVEKKTLTPDMNGTATTSEVGDAVVARRCTEGVIFFPLNRKLPEIHHSSYP